MEQTGTGGTCCFAAGIFGSAVFFDILMNDIKWNKGNVN